ncbi:MAG: HAMP domain-containing protein [Proteobacteria bacterium]|nr:HAMP domain-containing protein [Pseudomonadota bacterium]
MRSLSLRIQLVLLVLASAVASQGIGFGLLLLFPPPEPSRMTVAQVAEALTTTPDRVRALGLRREMVAAPPEPAPSGGPAARLISVALAAELGATPDRVRIHMRGGSDPDGPGAPPRIVTVTRRAFSVIVRRPDGSGLASIGAPSLLRGVMQSVPFPPFEAAVRQADGRWMLIRPDDPLFSPWRLRVLSAFGLSAILLTPLAWWSARRLTRPVQLFAEAAERLGLDPKAPPLDVAGPLEVRTAALSFNRMQDRLRGYVEGRTAMVAAIAHDLRTPLTSLRVRAETAPPAERDRMAADIERMDAMIAQVLAFVRGEQVREPAEPLDLSEVAASCVSDAAERGAATAMDASEPLPILGEPINLRRALNNLIENAVFYGGGARVAAVRDGTRAVVRVTDNGPGLPEADLVRVFEPFARGEPSRSRATGGVGLGLATARSIVRAHGGEIVLSNREGGGLIAEAVLPLRAPA